MMSCGNAKHREWTVEIDRCPKCGTAFFRGGGCPRCGVSEDGPTGPEARHPVTPIASAKIQPTVRMTRSGLKNGMVFAGILLGVLVVIVAVVYGVSSAHLKHDNTETRSGQTTAAYDQALTDAQEGTALLELIDAKPGYRTYTISHPDFAEAVSGLRNGTSTLSYDFETDEIAWTDDGYSPPLRDTWEGHGLERLRRQAQGGSLDDD